MAMLNNQRVMLTHANVHKIEPTWFTTPVGWFGITIQYHQESK